MLSITPNARAKKVELLFPTLPKLYHSGIRNAGYKVGDSVITRVKKMLTTGKRTGVKYPRLPHRSSAAGEPPRSQSGRLVRSGGYGMRGHTELRVFETVFYAKFLEDGTSKMRPRPHLIVAVDKEERNTDKYLLNEPLKLIKI